jgi:hypothetical protein
MTTKWSITMYDYTGLRLNNEVLLKEATRITNNVE